MNPIQAELSPNGIDQRFSPDEMSTLEKGGVSLPTFEHSETPSLSNRNVSHLTSLESDQKAFVAALESAEQNLSKAKEEYDVIQDPQYKQTLQFVIAKTLIKRGLIQEIETLRNWDLSNDLYGALAYEFLDTPKLQTIEPLTSQIMETEKTLRYKEGTLTLKDCTYRDFAFFMKLLDILDSIDDSITRKNKELNSLDLTFYSPVPTSPYENFKKQDEKKLELARKIAQQLKAENSPLADLALSLIAKEYLNMAENNQAESVMEKVNNNQMKQMFNEAIAKKRNYFSETLCCTFGIALALTALLGIQHFGRHAIEYLY